MSAEKLSQNYSEFFDIKRLTHVFKISIDTCTKNTIEQ